MLLIQTLNPKHLNPIHPKRVPGEAAVVMATASGCFRLSLSICRSPRVFGHRADRSLIHDLESLGLRASIGCMGVGLIEGLWV